MITYEDFIASKVAVVEPSGIPGVLPEDLHPALFDFQRAIVAWAIRRGRAAIFADCGMGKTPMQCAWIARMAGDGYGLIVAPLSVARQTIREAMAILGMRIEYVRDPSQIAGPGIYATNYEHVHKFDGSMFRAVVLDESSILKNSSGTTRGKLIESFEGTPYRLACTATPSPNDWEELTNHAEFLGVARRVEVLASFFVHDEDGWRIKGHATGAFFDWVSTWAVSVRRPSDLGYDDAKFVLPPLSIKAVTVPSVGADGYIFGGPTLEGVSGRSRERRATLDARVAASHEVMMNADGQCIAWCGLNDESKMLASMLGKDAVEITGSDDADTKEAAIMAFISGAKRYLVSKPSICGFGLNLQNAADMVFVGIGDSFETYYQTIRRCYRFGQTRPVTATIVHSEAEGEIVENVRRKEYDAMTMSEELVARCAARGEVTKHEPTHPDVMNVPTMEHRSGGDSWGVTHGDCIVVMKGMADHSIDFSVFSPPFATLYTYSDSPFDMGNCNSLDQFAEHFRFLPSELLRITKPGRICAMHVAQLTSTMAMDGVIGIKDFRGLVINEMKRGGWIHHGEITVDKCPQAQAIRTKSKSLLFVQKERDSSWLRPALADYVCLFRAPGENAVPIRNADVTREDWIEWARPIWYGIRESDTLNAAVAREERDERHVCPLQRELIERCIKLWSNKGEIVFSPFTGIGSEGYVAVKHGRRFLGAELKRSYFEQACRNIATQADAAMERTMFDDVECAS